MSAEEHWWRVARRDTIQSTMSGSPDRPLAEARMRTSPDLDSRLDRDDGTDLPRARKRTTEELVRVLEPYTGALDESGFRRLCERFPSAEEMARSLLDDRASAEGPGDVQVWTTLVVLWERWAPDEPSFESLDARMQLGYDATSCAERCEIWLGVWRDTLRLADRFGFVTLDGLDERFGGLQCFFNWVQDLELELGNAGVENETFHLERIRYCEEFLSRFPDEGPDIVENFRRALAEAHFETGREAAGERLFQEWLAADPTWGWGWIGWCDAYGLFASARKATADYPRAEEILLKALAVPDLRDREYVLERLADVYEAAGRRKDEERVRHELQQLRTRLERASVAASFRHAVTLRRSFDFGDEGIPLERLPDLRAAASGTPARSAVPKVGRNDPCPCGSGLKYKKCCLRRR